MIKESLKKIPLVKKIYVKMYKRLNGEIPFTKSNKYWERRYKKGGDSGAGSYNELAEFKGEVVNEFVTDNKIESVIEFGSGDGNQLKYFNFKSYTGFDVSITAVSICSKKYKSDPSKQFRLLKSYSNEMADLVLSLDVIYHLVEDEVYEDYMNRLFCASNKFVIIYSSNSDEHENNGVQPHVKHRNFTKWIDKNASNFKMIKHIPNKHPYDGNGFRTSYADFFIYRKDD